MKIMQGMMDNYGGESGRGRWLCEERYHRGRGRGAERGVEKCRVKEETRGGRKGRGNIL